MLHLDNDGASGRCIQWLQGPSGEEGAGGCWLCPCLSRRGGPPRPSPWGHPSRMIPQRAPDGRGGAPVRAPSAGRRGHGFQMGAGADDPPGSPRLRDVLWRLTGWVGVRWPSVPQAIAPSRPARRSVHGVSRAGQAAGLFGPASREPSRHHPVPLEWRGARGSPGSRRALLGVAWCTSTISWPGHPRASSTFAAVQGRASVSRSRLRIGTCSSVHPSPGPTASPSPGWCTASSPVRGGSRWRR